MFKWLKKQYKRYKLKNKSVLIQDENVLFNDIIFLEYFPGKNIMKSTYGNFESPSEKIRNIIINHNTKIVYIEKYPNLSTFKEAGENLKKDILNAYDRYVEELQELEML